MSDSLAYQQGYQAGAADAESGNTPPYGWERATGDWANGYRAGREDAKDWLTFGACEPVEEKR